jgi:peroxiredoxin Q/BCP
MLAPNDKAPGFSLPGQDGVIRSLADFAGKKLILFFYPKANTGG